MQATNILAAAGVLGAIGITIGAFGAHGLPDWLADQGYSPDEVTRRLATFEPGARYHMYAALALLGVGVAAHVAPRRAWTLAAWLLLIGVAIFSGLLYTLAVAGDDFRWLGGIVPIGGLLQIAGWGAIAYSAWSRNGGTSK